MDAITLLKADHKAVKRLFREFEKLGDRATIGRREVVDKIIHELSAHAAIEEQLFYPVARSAVAEAEDQVLEALEEHHVVKWLLSELEHLPADAERFKAKVTVLIESVEHHADEEESDLFPKVRAAMGRKALAELGARMEQAKKRAPSRPHPRLPDTPPGNVALAPAVALVDRVTSKKTRPTRTANASG